MKFKITLISLILAFFTIIPSSAFAINCNHAYFGMCTQECNRWNRASQDLQNGCWLIIGCWLERIEENDAYNDLLNCLNP